MLVVAYNGDVEASINRCIIAFKNYFYCSNANC